MTARQHQVDLRELRVPAALMLGAGVARGFLAHPPGIACPLRTLTGVPCPLCGMTTSVTATTHLHLLAAASANPFGVVAVVVAIIVVAARTVDRISVPAWTAPALLALSWSFELLRFHVL
jgi:hypothetical protein